MQRAECAIEHYGHEGITRGGFAGPHCCNPCKFRTCSTFLTTLWASDRLAFLMLTLTYQHHRK